ncbi:MAG TPA: hypothetical protein VFU21_05760 [Kofleriaceae bacterium]|nr:hypothetical protein [Kofleriaceae bacterium]
MTVLLLALAGVGPAYAQPASGPSVVLFWSSAGQADADARAALLPAVERAARAAGAVAADLSPAAPPVPATADMVARAIAAYDGMRFTDAAYELDRAAVAAAEHGGRGLSRDQLVDLFLYRALARTEAGNTAGAWDDFVRAATLDPTRLLDPARFRPSAVKSFTLAVEQVKKRAAVALDVSAPAGSKVVVDGRPTGRDRVSENLLPGEHYVWVERPAAAPFARVVTLAAATQVAVPEDAARPPGDAELARRAARLGSGPLLAVALRREGGVGLVELRSVGPRGATLRGVLRLGPSPEASARDLERSVLRALRAMRGELARAARPATVTAPPRERWYKNRWLWLGVGVVATAAALSPFVLSGDGGESPTDAALDPSALK